MRAFIDTNVFVYASFPKFTQHSIAKEFLKSCLSGFDSWHLSWGVVYEYLRVATHQKLFSGEVLPLSQAVENVQKFISSPQVEILQETQDHHHYLNDLTSEPHLVSGSIFHDAHSVALMREHDIKKIVTADTDFHRFKGIEVVNPFA
jgi:toxin-antitoxin system PIN domain toxin